MRRRYLSHSASTSSVVLGLFGLLLVLMPVSYRAGTSTAHAHTVFQSVIDQVRGTPHHHAEDHAAPDVAPAEPAFLALNVPLSTIAALESPSIAVEMLIATNRLTHVAESVTTAATGDIPEITSVTTSADAIAALTLLVAMVALLLILRPERRIWFSNQILNGVGSPIESPPPKHVVC